jgi:hypothetical protein
MSNYAGVPPAFAQMADELSSNLQDALTPDSEAGAILQEHFLRAQSEVLKGLLAVVDRQIQQVSKRSKAQQKREKIPVS